MNDKNIDAQSESTKLKKAQEFKPTDNKTVMVIFIVIVLGVNLEGRGYYVRIGEHKSKRTSMTSGVPQGSILAPLLFSLYMLPLSQTMRKNQICYHSYADDTQIYLALSPNDYSPIDSLCQSIDEVNNWMC